MKIYFHKKFDKQFGKLKKTEQEAVLDAIELFRKDTNNPKLKNHALKGNLKSQRAIHARFDLCLIYRELANAYEILFLKVGTHEQVY